MKRDIAYNYQNTMALCAATTIEALGAGAAEFANQPELGQAMYYTSSAIAAGALLAFARERIKEHREPQNHSLEDES